MFGIVFAVMANVLTYKVFGGSYYEEHRWPKLAVLLGSGLACLLMGVSLKRYRKRTGRQFDGTVASMSHRHPIANDIASSGPQDHLMYIPLQYWCIPYFVGAIVYVVMTTPAA